jgi:hypothetical protein
MEIGDKVQLYLDEEIKKAETAPKRKPYATESVLKLWKALNGRIGTITGIDGEDIWVTGPQGMARMFNESVLKRVENE